MTKLVNGRTKTKQHIKQKLLDKHCDIFLQEFINKSFAQKDNDDVINNNNLNYFHHNNNIFDNFKQTVDKLLLEVIESYLISVGFEKNKHYIITGNKIKTNPIVFIKVLSAYDYNAELATMLKNVLVYC